jgi:hypothetical protein
MSVTIRVHYDGKVLVPDEPVDLPVNEPLAAELNVVSDKLSPGEIERRLAALREVEAHAVHGLNISDEALRRENMYEDRGL